MKPALACNVGVVSAHRPVRVMDPGSLPRPVEAHQSPLGCLQPGLKRDGTDSVSMSSSSDPLRSPVPIQLASSDPRPPLIPTATTSPRQPRTQSNPATTRSNPLIDRSIRHRLGHVRRRHGGAGGRRRAAAAAAGRRREPDSGVQLQEAAILLRQSR